MTPQEAIDIIDDVSWEDNGRHYGKIVPARDLAKSALEKQIPKKPLQACGHATDKTMNYCPVCGQALEWSDTE